MKKINLVIYGFALIFILSFSEDSKKNYDFFQKN